MNQVSAAKEPHIVVVGAGFGGIRVARAFKNKHVRVTLIDRNNYHLFQPLLYQVSTAVLAEGEIAYPVRAFFRKHKNVNFFLGNVLDFDLEKKAVITDQGPVNYDYLVLAAGSTTNYFGMNGVAQHAFSMKTLNESVRIRNHILKIFEQADKEADPAKRREMLNFVCVGGGPTGVEEAGAISELIYKVMKKEYHNLDFSDVSIQLVEAAGCVLPMMPEGLRAETVRVLEKKKVTVRLNTQVMDYDGRILRLHDGTALPTRTVIWAAGVKASPLAARMGVDTDRGGRVCVRRTLQISDHPEVYAIGDNASFLQDGRPLPTIAPVATQQADLCVKNILHSLRQEPMEFFEYHDIGSMATIGCGNAVMYRGIFKSRGFFAWSLWMAVHLLRLSGLHSNTTVMLKWIWNLFSGTRLGRIITQ